MLAEDLAERLPTVKAPRRKPRPYSAEQIGALLDSGGYTKTRAMIKLGFYQGFRAGEIAAVHGHDIDLDANTITVVGKADKRATMPLHAEIRTLALTMPRDDWWFPARNGAAGHIHSRSVSDLLRRAKERAGITNERLTGHSLRHSYGTELVRAGVDLRTVQELMRHESLATTQLYTAIGAEQMRDGLDRLARRDTESTTDREDTK
jgi:site-specific recombinase XerD